MKSTRTMARLLSFAGPAGAHAPRPQIDTELQAMANCLSDLQQLTPAARDRALKWLAERCEEMREYHYEE